MADERFHIEAQGEHEYLLRADSPAAADPVAARVVASVSVLDRLGVDGDDELRAVAATMAFLAEKQPVADFPPLIDLEDVAAAYDDYYDTMRRRLRHGS